MRKIPDLHSRRLQHFLRNYIEHILKGVELADQDPESLLVFSGGQTRREAGPRSEAQSYWMVANHFRWWWRTNVSLRATTEEYARDSYENFLFSICRFIECTGNPCPDKVTVVSWTFKKERFDLHRDAIRFPSMSARYDFKGVNNPVDLNGAIESEIDNARDPFNKDPYGSGDNPHTYAVKGNTRTVNLRVKRQERNPFNRVAPYELSCPALTGLLQYPSQHRGTQVYSGSLPW
jgi:hypothetical protein